jgi:hypothetical protein
MRRPYLGAIGELVFGEVDLSERAFAYQLPKSIVSDILEILVRKFAVGSSKLAQSSKFRPLYECVTLTQGALGMTWQAIQQSSSQHKVTLQDFPRIPKIPWPFVPAPRLSPYLFAYPPLRAAKTAFSLAHDRRVSRVLEISATVSLS